MKKVLALVFIIVAFVLAGCQTTGTNADGSKPVAKKAQKKSKGSKGTIYALIEIMDPGTLNKSQLNSQRDLAKYMRRDLKKRFKKKGPYDVVIINKASEFKGGKKSYLLKVKFHKYVRMSSAARSFIGFGGVAQLYISYELTDSSGKTIISKKDNAKTSSAWKALPKLLNNNMLREIKVKVY